MNPFKVWLLRLSLAAFTGCLMPVASSAESNQLAMNLIFQRTLPSIVSITVRDHNDELRRGSGFFVNNNGMFITAFSVVEDAQRITVRTEDGWLHSVDEVVALSRENNLALLRAPLTRTRTLEVISPDTAVAPGETAIAVSGAEGLEWHISDGKLVTAPDGDQSESGYLHFSNQLKPGNQGGPLINRYGRVMGVLLPPLEDSESQRAIPAADIHALLDKVNVLPLSATWTQQPPPPPAPARTIEPEPATEEETKTAGAESEQETPETPADKPEVMAEAEPAEPAEKSPDQAPKPEPPPEPGLPQPAGKVAQHLGQVQSIAWASVPSQPDPARVCPPMINLELERELRWRVMGNRAYADGHLSLGGRLDTGKECNMWGCFDGYRLYMHFVISNSQGKTLYREYFEVDEDDVNEACEELAEDIADELDDLLD